MPLFPSYPPAGPTLKPCWFNTIDPTWIPGITSNLAAQTYLRPLYGMNASFANVPGSFPGMFALTTWALSAPGNGHTRPQNFPLRIGKRFGALGMTPGNDTQAARVQQVNRTGLTSVISEGAGPSVGVMVNQRRDDPGGWTIDVYGIGDDKDTSEVYLGQVVLAAGTVHPATRLVFIASIPGLYRFRAAVTAPAPAPLRGIEVGVFAGDVTALAPTNVST